VYTIDWNRFVSHIDYYCERASSGYIVIIDRDDGQIVLSTPFEEIDVDDDGPLGFEIRPRPPS
jgi:hypothetical protein